MGFSSTLKKLCSDASGAFFRRFTIGMKLKLVFLFAAIILIPLIIIVYISYRQSFNLADRLNRSNEAYLSLTNAALGKIRDSAVADSRKAIDERARFAIERLSTNTAKYIADFLYERDDDIRYLAKLEPTPENYRTFIEERRGRVVSTGKWELSEDESIWVPAEGNRFIPPPPVSSNSENNINFHYFPPTGFKRENRPLYHEITFLDLTGRERVKVTSSNLFSGALKDVSRRENTFIKAETYFPELLKLKPGEIYVSEVIGAYVGSKIIGTYNHENARKAGIPFEPSKSAYAGRENPLGKPFKGIIRWGFPVTGESGKITGFVTMALDYDHIMEFTSHLVPTDERYTEIPDASKGNYAFVWDYKGRNISHPRHFSIAGYDPETGEPQVPWLEDKIYNTWKASGKSYTEFIKGVKVFDNQSNDRNPAWELADAGLVGLDCRYLNFAPNCTGWMDLTKDGGSGSFVMLWSGILKRNAAAAIQYYTGRYGASKRGFGFVTIGLGVNDFHKAADDTQESINTMIMEANEDIREAALKDRANITQSLHYTARFIGAAALAMSILAALLAFWLAHVFTGRIKRFVDGISRFHSGERQFRFNAKIKDEMGLLADSFDGMADSIVHSSTYTVIITDLLQRIKYINDIGLQKFGKTFEELQGKFFYEVTVAPRELRYDPVHALLMGGETEVYELKNKYFRMDASYLFDRADKPIGYIIRATDVTEIFLEHRKAEEQRVVLNTIFNKSSDLIWYQNAKSEYIAVNPRFASIAGLSPDELTGKTSKIFDLELARILDEHDRRVYDEKKSVSSEEDVLFKDGHTEIVESVRTPIFDGSGETQGILGMGRNISKRKNAERQLREAQEELKEAVNNANRANRAKSDFLARMSHELRTPLNAIIGMADISKMRMDLSSGTLEKAEIEPYIEKITASSRHLLGLINDILDLTNIEAGKLILTKEPFNIFELINEVDAIIRPRAEIAKINFTINLDSMIHQQFKSDPLRIKQVLLNLLGNAVKFTRMGGTVNLTMMLFADSVDMSNIIFAVTDSGIGMNEDQRASLFEPFEQGSVVITRNYGGTGLGLSLCHNIVEMLGGSIQAESAMGVGSVFTVELNLEKHFEHKDMEDSVKGKSGFREGTKVLLVDDNIINRTVLREQLKARGIIVDEAEDGDVAVDMFLKSAVGEYKVIFMDIQMPRMDGNMASKAIRQLERGDAKSVVIVAVSANTFKEDVDNALAHGMNAHISKPVEFEKLFRTTEKLLG